MQHVSKTALMSGAIELKDAEDDPNAIVQKALDDLRTNIDERLKALETKGGESKLDDIEKKLADAQKRADDLELKLNRPGAVVKKDDAKELETKAFSTFIRRGREALDPTEFKSLRVSDDTAGGYLAPAEFSREVDKNLVLFSPVRQAARVGATSSGSVIVPRRTGAPTATWTGETETRSATGSAYGQIEIDIEEAACYVDVSNKLLEDAAVDIAAEVAFDLAEEFGRIEGLAFVSGDGVKKPSGFMSDTNVGYTAGGHAIGPERVPGGLALFAASDREQARIGFEEASGICREDERIEKALRFIDYRHRIEHPKSGASLRAISCDAARQHGSTPTFALVDELHAWPKRDLWDVLRTGLVKTPGSLLVVITTAGRGHENVAHDVVDYARRVARGEIDDPGTLPILFETAADADWRDEEVWRRANPGLAQGFPDIEGLRQLALEAEARPADREAFKQLHLNVWLDHSVDPFVDMAIYDEGAEPLDLEAIAGEPCYIGVDLSSNSDLTVVVALWRVGTGYAVLPHFFCPADNLRGRQDRDAVPYVRWADEGHIEPTQGDVVDFRAVEDCIRDLCGRFDVREIGLDPHLARSTLNNLAEDGLPAVEVRQGWVTMAPAIKELERAIVGRQFQHGGHPVLRWCFDNVVVETDRAGNRLFTKGKARERIDGAVACAIAISVASNDDAGPSVYETSERPDGFLFV